MRLTITIAGALLALALAAPVGAATPDSYQPQLREQGSSDDVVSRYLRRHAPGVFQPQVGGAARHPDSLGFRGPVPAMARITAAPPSDTFAWEAFVGGIAGGVVLALLGLAAVRVGGESRRLAPR